MAYSDWLERGEAYRVAEELGICRDQWVSLGTTKKECGVCLVTSAICADGNITTFQVGFMNFTRAWDHITINKILPLEFNEVPNLPNYDFVTTGATDDYDKKSSEAMLAWTTHMFDKEVWTAKQVIAALRGAGY